MRVLFIKFNGILLRIPQKEIHFVPLCFADTDTFLPMSDRGCSAYDIHFGEGDE